MEFSFTEVPASVVNVKSGYEKRKTKALCNLFSYIQRLCFGLISACRTNKMFDSTLLLEP